MLDVIFKLEDQKEIERFTMLLKKTNEQQHDTMDLVMKSMKLGIEIGRNEVTQTSVHS